MKIRKLSNVILVMLVLQKKGNMNVPILSFKCNTCEPSFALKYDLKEHITSVHEGKNPYECNICNTGSAKRNHLKTHGIST